MNPNVKRLLILAATIPTVRIIHKKLQEQGENWKEEYQAKKAARKEKKRASEYRTRTVK
jgi:hypothetical protein